MTRIRKERIEAPVPAMKMVKAEAKKISTLEQKMRLKNENFVSELYAAQGHMRSRTLTRRKNHTRLTGVLKRALHASETLAKGARTQWSSKGHRA